MSKEEAELWQEFCTFYRVHHQTHDPPKKTPASDGEEISLGDLTVPPELTKIESRNENHKKIVPDPTQQ